MTLIPIRQFNELISPQAQMLGRMGKRDLYGSYETYLESLSEQLPEEYALAEERRMLEEEQKLEAQARKQARRDAYISMGIRGADVVLKAYPYLKDMATKPTTSPMAKAGVGLTTSYEKPAEIALTKGAPSLVPSYATESALSKGVPALTTSATEEAPGVLSTLGTKSAAPLRTLSTATIGAGAGKLYEMASDRYDWSKKLHKGVKEVKEKEFKKAGEIASGALTGFITSGFNPLGAVAGGVGAYASSQCIIVSACTDPDSYEVNIAREYRDKFMDKSMLRGYYRIAETIVAYIKKYWIIRMLTKEILVNRLVKYGEYKLKYTQKKPNLMDIIITRGFLNYCRYIGNKLPLFRRLNGEVI